MKSVNKIGLLSGSGGWDLSYPFSDSHQNQT